MGKKISKLSILRKEFSEFSENQSMTFREFIEQKSLQSNFWPWFFEDKYIADLSEEQEVIFQRFLNTADKIQTKRKRIKEKDTHLHIKLSAADKEKYQNKAKKLGMSLSSYIRKTVDGEKIIVKTDYEMVHQIRKIGVNINQITHKINQNPNEKNIINGIQIIGKYMKDIQDIIEKIEK